MNAGHIIYPSVVLIAALLTVLNRHSIALRIMIVCLLTGFILLGLDTTPGANARAAIDTRTDQNIEDFRDGVVAATDAIRGGNRMLMVPIAGLALIALIPLKRRKSQQIRVSKAP